MLGYVPSNRSPEILPTFGRDLAIASTLAAAVLASCRPIPAATSPTPEVSQAAASEPAASLLPSPPGNAQGTPLPPRDSTPAPEGTELPLARNMEGWPPGEIVFVSFGQAQGKGSGLFSMHSDGTDLEAVLHSEAAPPESPACSPSGNRIAFASDLAQPGQMDVFLVNLDGSGLAQLTTSKRYETMPAWSPDEKSIVIAVAGLPWSIETLSLDQGPPKQFAVGSTDLMWPSWSPDGEQLAFLAYAGTRDESIKSDLYRILITDNGGKVQATLDEPSSAGGRIAWSPDGRWIAFSGPGCKLYRTTPDGITVEKLTEGTGCHRNPSWSPDATYIVFDASDPQYPNWGRDILAVNVETRELYSVRDDPATIANSSPTWCPLPVGP